MSDLAPLLDPALEGGTVVNVGVPVRPGLVGREDEAGGLELDEATLDRELQGVAVEDTEQQIVLDPAVELVEDDGVLPLVAVEPDVAVSVRLGEDVGVRVLVGSFASLAGAGLTPVDVDLRDGLTVSVGSLGGLEGLNAPVILDELDGELVGDLGDVVSLLYCSSDSMQVGPVLPE